MALNPERLGKMTFFSFIWFLCRVFFKSLWWYLTFIPPVLIICLVGSLSKNYDLPLILTIPITLGLLQIPFFLNGLKKEMERYFFYECLKIEDARRKFDLFKHKEDVKIEKEFKEIERQKLELERDRDKVRTAMFSKVPFKMVAEMRTTLDMEVFKRSINWLENKDRPAFRAAEEVRRMQQISSKIMLEYKEFAYKYDYLLYSFPEIAEYIENDEDLICIAEKFSYQDLEDNSDKRRDYLSRDEYVRLSEAEKSQLSLDRYVNGLKKNKWQIGRDYEMSCAFQFERKGYTVEMHGIKYKKEDLGRDLIAIRENDCSFGKEILIIQCKNWSHDRIIRENVIMQLYATAMEYQISNRINANIVPVLAVPPYSQISEMAIKFAERLKIRIERMQNLEFPRIKCNINNGNKIYHLPFDQLYDRTEIKFNGECYAFTVEEAERKGFRRAMRHWYNN